MPAKSDKKKYYVIDPDNDSDIIAGPKETVEELQKVVEELINDGDIEPDGFDMEFSIAEVVGTLIVFSRPQTKVKMLKEE